MILSTCISEKGNVALAGRTTATRLLIGNENKLPSPGQTINQSCGWIIAIMLGADRLLIQKEGGLLVLEAARWSDCHAGSSFIRLDQEQNIRRQHYQVAIFAWHGVPCIPSYA